jgi:ABC-type multidrug transport system ATPase subunit
MTASASFDAISLSQIRLSEVGPTVSLTLGRGQRLAVVGPGASGKSRLLRAIGNQDRIAEGNIQTSGRVFWLEPGSLPPRQRLSNLLKRSGPDNSQQATDLLVATRLWDFRNEPVSNLSPSQEAAAEVLMLLNSDADVTLWDGQLDDLDPWTLETVWQQIQIRNSAGKTDVFATHRPEIVEMCDAVLVLLKNEFKFAGAVADLRKSAGDTELRVITEHQAAVRAILAPFQVSIQAQSDGLLIRAKEGQAIAAKLLSQGYGDVECVFLRAGTVQSALRKLFV